MLKIKKRSAIALIASAVVSRHFADKQFNDDVSYALGYLWENI